MYDEYFLLLRVNDFTCKENLSLLKMNNTLDILDILDNYLESVIKEKTNIVEVLDHILTNEAKANKKQW